MTYNYNELTGTANQIAYATKLLKDAIHGEGYLIGAYEEQAAEFLASDDTMNQLIASGIFEGYTREQITTDLIVIKMLQCAAVEGSERETAKLQNLGRALESTDAGEIISLLK